MGTWGEGPLENDAALDVVSQWKEVRATGLPKSRLTPEATLNAMLNSDLGATFSWGDADTIARIIAVAALFERDGLPIRGKILEYFEEAISIELRAAALREWDSPKKRKRALETLLKKIGGKKRRIAHSRLLAHPAIEFSSQDELMSKLERWLPGIASHKLSEFPSDQEYPRLWKVLDRVMRSRTKEMSDSVHVEAVRQRFMLLAGYLGVYGLLPVEDAVALVRAVKGQYRLIGHHLDRWEEFSVPLPDSTPPTEPARKRTPKR